MFGVRPGAPDSLLYEGADTGDVPPGEGTDPRTVLVIELNA